MCRALAHMAHSSDEQRVVLQQFAHLAFAGLWYRLL